MIGLKKPARIKDRKYVAWIKKQPCFALQWKLDGGYDLGPCVGPLDPHHFIAPGQGRTGSKVDDRLSLPACRGHHDYAHANKLVFAVWFQAFVETLQNDYSVLFQAKAIVERKRSPRINVTIDDCPNCGGSHKFKMREGRHKNVGFFKDFERHLRMKTFCKDWF